MIDWTAPLTVTHVGVAIGAMAIGVIGHEACHYAAFRAFGHRPDVDFEPSKGNIEVSSEDELQRYQMALVSLAPLIWVATGLLAFVLIVPETHAWAVYLVLIGFIVGAMPSLPDFITAIMYDPEAAKSQEVMT